MKPKDEEVWEAEYWDDYLKSFGKDAYYQARYGVHEDETGVERGEGEVLYSTTKACGMCGEVHPV